MKLSKVTIIVATAVAMTLSSGVSAFASEGSTPKVAKVALTADQKAAVKAARAQFQAAHVARQASIAAAKAAVATAKANFAVARLAATTPEEKQAARQILKAAIEAAKASVPAKPIRPSRP